MLTEACFAFEPTLQKVVYDGLVDAVGASEDDILYINSTISFSIAGYKTFQQSMLEATEVPVCPDYYRSNEDGSKIGDCPEDGAYTFSADYNFPDIEGYWIDWAASGFKGKIYFDIFFNEVDDVLAGRCEMEIETVSTQTYAFKVNGKDESAPTGRLGAIIALSVLCAAILCCCHCCLAWLCYRRADPRKHPLLPSEETEPQDLENLKSESNLHPIRPSSRSFGFTKAKSSRVHAFEPKEGATLISGAASTEDDKVGSTRIAPSKEEGTLAISSEAGEEIGLESIETAGERKQRRWMKMPLWSRGVRNNADVPSQEQDTDEMVA